MKYPPRRSPEARAPRLLTRAGGEESNPKYTGISTISSYEIPPAPKSRSQSPEAFDPSPGWPARSQFQAPSARACCDPICSTERGILSLGFRV
eukprot:CAMPEP_0182856982 /NCGR_PEP_ID=MMETSP0034_2-20130328/2779_1 /TAXON_ID=156128 /ORGANISM="Nephroselmis pyriformis, Strain CCMP717" /LENGTH=92 /DNA_ID=CAMNT_0024988159 /DNA_START=1 /DNA_END=279 /DNA_ORIENTATION=+